MRFSFHDIVGVLVSKHGLRLRDVGRRPPDRCGGAGACARIHFPAAGGSSTGARLPPRHLPSPTAQTAAAAARAAKPHQFSAPERPGGGHLLAPSASADRSRAKERSDCRRATGRHYNGLSHGGTRRRRLARARGLKGGGAFSLFSLKKHLCPKGQAGLHEITDDAAQAAARRLRAAQRRRAAARREGAARARRRSDATAKPRRAAGLFLPS